MKILHVPFHYYPEAVGGTEVYVTALAKHLQQQGVEVEIAAPGEVPAEYMHDGIPVHRFGITKKPAITMLYGQGDPLAARGFVEILDKSRPDLVHLHAMSPAVSLIALKKVKDRGIPVVFTCHIPGVTCQRGSLLRYGREVCDGRLGVQKCTACSLQRQGFPVPLAAILSRIPHHIGRGLAASGYSGSVVTALRMRELLAMRHRALAEFFDHADRVIAVCGWLHDVLIANGVDSNKVILCRHGATREIATGSATDYVLNDSFRVAFLGRLNPDKGIHILIEAMRLRPQMRMTLDIFGIVQDDIKYAAMLRTLAEGDQRIRWRNAVPNETVIDTLRTYDALAVPSQWLETGPLVVYDAFAAGIPVIGSDRGGIAELVSHDRDGWLVECDNAEAWASALERMCDDEDLRTRLRAGVRPPRSMATVAQEMRGLYSELTNAHQMTTVERG